MKLNRLENQAQIFPLLNRIRFCFECLLINLKISVIMTLHGI